MIIRKANIEDVDLMVKINSNSGYKWRGNPKKVKSYIIEDFKKRDPKNFFPFIVEINKKPVAYYILFVKHNECWMDFLSVYKLYQKKGIGSLIIKKSISLAKRKRCKKILLNVWSKNYPAISVYNRLGFYVKDIKRNYFKNGDDKIVMEKLL